MNARKGTLRLVGTGDNELLFQSDCLLSDEHGQLTITFDESESGMDNTQSVIVVTDGLLTLHRTGDYDSCLIFERGRDMPVSIRSPFGSMELRLQTRRLDIVRNGDGVVADIEYNFCAGEQIAMRNGLHLECGVDADSADAAARMRRNTTLI